MFVFNLSIGLVCSYCRKGLTDRISFHEIFFFFLFEEDNLRFLKVLIQHVYLYWFLLTRTTKKQKKILFFSNILPFSVLYCWKYFLVRRKMPNGNYLGLQILFWEAIQSLQFSFTLCHVFWNYAEKPDIFEFLAFKHKKSYSVLFFYIFSPRIVVIMWSNFLDIFLQNY